MGFGVSVNSTAQAGEVGTRLHGGKPLLLKSEDSKSCVASLGPGLGTTNFAGLL